MPTWKIVVISVSSTLVVVLGVLGAVWVFGVQKAQHDVAWKACMTANTLYRVGDGVDTDTFVADHVRASDYRTNVDDASQLAR